MRAPTARQVATSSRRVLSCAAVFVTVVLPVCAAAAAGCELRDENARVAENPRSAAVYVSRATCLLEIPPNKAALPPDRMKAAVKDLETALALEPNIFVVREKYAGVSYLDGKYAVAKAEYTKVIAQNPLSASSHLGRGWALLKLCQFQDANADFKSAAFLDASLKAKAPTSQQVQQEWASCAPKPPAR